jgi:hypothetical protein
MRFWGQKSQLRLFIWQNNELFTTFSDSYLGLIPFPISSRETSLGIGVVRMYNIMVRSHDEK